MLLLKECNANDNANDSHLQIEAESNKTVGLDSNNANIRMCVGAIFVVFCPAAGP